MPNIISRLFSKTPPTAEAPPTAEERRRCDELKLAEAKLATLRKDWDDGRTSGHPEEALMDIEDANRRVQKLSVPSSPPAVTDPPRGALRHVELGRAEAKLSTLRRQYKTGQYSGHPEDMLWDIEDAEKRVKSLSKA